MGFLTSVMFCVSLWLSLLFILNLVLVTCRLVIDKKAHFPMIVPTLTAICWTVYYHLVMNP